MNIGNQLMTSVIAIGRAATFAVTNVARRLRAGIDDDPERGDVPGWVMITLMTAILVAGLLAIAGPALETMFEDAMGRIGQ